MCTAPFWQTTLGLEQIFENDYRVVFAKWPVELIDLGFLWARPFVVDVILEFSDD